MENRRKQITLNATQVGEALLELLALRDVEYFFAVGSGTDFPAIIEAYTQEKQSHYPKAVIAVHELPGIAMAHGYAMVAEKTPCIMLHTIVGGALGVMGIINAARAKIPLYVIAGRTAITEKGQKGSRSHIVHWGQESFDQGTMFREFVKWDYELRTPDQLETLVDRGLAISQSKPQGPIYLALPVEISGAPLIDHKVYKSPQLTPVTAGIPDELSIKKAIELLSKANNPIILVSMLGKESAAVTALINFAEAMSIGVIESNPSYMNFPQNHPLHLGFDVSSSLDNADVILLIETPVPWLPSDQKLSDYAIVISLGDDPLYSQYPYRSFPNDLSLLGDPSKTLTALLQQCPIKQNNKKRLEQYKKYQQSNQTLKQANIDHSQDLIPISPTWVAHCLSQVLQPLDIVITEFILDLTQTCFTQAGTYFNHASSGGLGWSLGAALGAKLAKPDRRVICVVGDGTYTFGVPVATHHMSALHDLPVLFIVLNNAAWDRTRMASRAFSNHNTADNKNNIPLCELSPTPAYEDICKAAGGYGEKVEDPNELPAALIRALTIMDQENKQVLLNVITSKSQ